MFGKLFIFVIILSALTLAQAQEETEPATASAITATHIPKGAERVLAASVPGEVSQAFEKLIAAGEGKIVAGERKVLAWTDGYKKSNAPGLMKQVQKQLQADGWIYEVGGSDDEFEVFSLLKEKPNRRAVLGFFVSGKEALVLALMEVLPNEKPSNNQTKTENSKVETRPTIDNSSAVILNVEKNFGYVNVMGNQMPELPSFPAVAKKPGYLRGYVKDVSGKPLEGAYIGVRATAVGGLYSGAHAETNAKGYYEIKIPWGVADLYAAGYTIDWGDGQAGMSLHSVDGKTGSFASATGAVKNFVLLPYGIISRDNLSESPHLSATSYGGSIYIGYWTREEGDNYAPPQNIPENSIIEITLTPEGKLFDGSEDRSFVIRKPAFSTGFKINNIPLGRYKINAKLANGKPLKMSLNKPKGTIFGMSPSETTGSAGVLFQPGDAKASMVIPNYGNWNAVEISVEMKVTNSSRAGRIQNADCRAELQLSAGGFCSEQRTCDGERQ